ncbi:MAG: hypothetical protein ACLQU4_06695, partial [Limisphaerales bacterium]
MVTGTVRTSIPREILAFVLPASAGKSLETPSPTRFGRKNRGSKPSGKKRQKAATNLPQLVASTCRLLSLGARFDFNEQFTNLGRARVTPSDRKISAARPNLAHDCAESRKLDGATAGKTSCEMLR